MKRFTQDEDQFIRDNYLQLSLNQLGDKLNRSFGSVAGRMRLLGLILPEEIKRQRHIDSFKTLTDSGKITRFKKGQIPHNKGQKVSKSTYSKMKPTMFKKGQMPHNTKYFGKPFLYERERNGKIERTWLIVKDGTRKGYLKHLCEESGIDMKGMKPRLKPGFDYSRPPTIDDILIVTKEEHMELNSIVRYPKELRSIIHLHSKLKKQIYNGKEQTK